MKYFQQWQLNHYAERIAAELKAGNTKAVAFLRKELYNLKNKSNA